MTNNPEEQERAKTAERRVEALEAEVGRLRSAACIVISDEEYEQLMSVMANPADPTPTLMAGIELLRSFKNPARHSPERFCPSAASDALLSGRSRTVGNSGILAQASAVADCHHSTCRTDFCHDYDDCPRRLRPGEMIWATVEIVEPTTVVESKEQRDALDLKDKIAAGYHRASQASAQPSAADAPRQGFLDGLKAGLAEPTAPPAADHAELAREIYNAAHTETHPYPPVLVLINHIAAALTAAERAGAEKMRALDEAVIPDFIYDPDDWEATYAWQDRALLADNHELHWRANREPIQFKTLVRGPDKWAANIVLKWDTEGDAEEEEIRWFASEDEARQAIVDAFAARDAAW